MSNQVLSLSTTMVSQNHAIDTEDAIIMEHVKATHDPRGEIMDVDTSSILNFVDDIFNSDTIPQEATQDKLMLKEYIQNEISSHVLQLSLKVACSCLNNVDSHSIAICLLSTLSVYPWHTKAVMMLTSFAIIYGKFKVVSQSRQRRGLTYNLALSKQMSSSNPKNLEDNSIKSALDLVKLMVELKHSSPMIVANYWIARFVVACTRLCILDPESQIQLAEQSKLSTKIKEIMASSHSLLEAKRAEENYQALLHAFDNSSDILEVLKLIFDVKNDEDEVILHLNWLLKLDRGLLQKEISPCRLDLFRGKEVLLLISSGRHFPFYVYDAPRGVQMIWVPITKVEKMGLQIIHNYVHLLGSVMIRHKPVAQVFRRFLEDKCFPIFQVGGDPIVISLDKRGRLVHYNALHMILTWRYQLYEETTMNHDLLPSLENELRERTLGADRVIGDIDKQIHDFASQVRKNINNWVNDIKDKMRSSFRSYNYTSEVEQTLSDKESWSLKLVVSDILYRSEIDKWIDDEEYIFLCGGNNNKQVQELILKIQEICSKIQMNWRIVYIGRSGKTFFDEDVIRMCDSTVTSEQRIKEFWTRLQSMASSRIQYLLKMGLDEGSDEIMQGVKKLLVYEAEGSTVGVWALLSKEKGIIACDMGDKMLGVMNEYEKWKDNAQINGFDRAFKDCYEMMLSSSSPTSYQHPYCFLNYPSNLEKIPNTQSCPQCNHNMHKLVTFSCCHTFVDCPYETGFIISWKNLNSLGLGIGPQSGSGPQMQNLGIAGREE
ncbi:PREDICTED: protein SIEVE ELEMENT OCCLUSION B-like [Ipomoea nil]|uniref:protein SIEVE ELEMENT OCCLUSION B-like n=1 Tax=Ipomoea nil TaxID=35883 RepID=UPI00090120E8|nr:PREDICTED: protein SIEVE ELEMENT OCCLUSION B-like [Ipomoea nil]